MIYIENTEVSGWQAAIRGMRNPLNSWDKSDSYYDVDEYEMKVGDRDLDLMQRLVKSGTDHSKFTRFINVTCDITAPLYWWSQFDTYKLGTVANSCSKMHKIHAKKFELSDFSTDQLTNESMNLLKDTINLLNFYRKSYNETKNVIDWWQMIQLLPSSYNQRRTVQMNYQNIAAMVKARSHHKLYEWHDFCRWAHSLPLFDEVMDPQ